ncbi:MAG: hypothetical protein ACYC46_01730 [Acidobacteriaceae bacterium]
MKHIVRAFAIALVAVGAFASTHTDASAATAKTQAVAMQSAYPIPTCPPDGSTTCGLGLR